LIHLRVPAATKARWVRASRAAGMRLTDWIVQHVEARMKQQTIVIPEGISFGDLRLSRDADGMISHDWVAIDAVCAASGISPDMFRGEGAGCSLLVRWFGMHLAHGGTRDPVMDDLLAEVAAEDA